MEKKVFKKAFAAAVSTLMMVPTSVFAQAAAGTYTTTDSIIDTTKTGSITLYKYLDNDGASVDAEGVAYAGNAQDMVGAIRQLTGNDSIMPEKGVQFKLLKVADIEQVSETKDRLGVTGTYYTNIDQGFFKLMNDYLGADKLVASDSTRVTDGRTDANAASEANDHYESDELNEKMMKVIRAKANTSLPESVNGVTGEVALNRYLRANANAQSFAVTDENGFTKLDNLPLGLYLICETDFEHSALAKRDTFWEVVADHVDDAGASLSETNIGDTSDAGTENSGLTAGGKNAGGSQYADIASPASPFLISVPMTNITAIKDANGVEHQPGKVWQYDIVAYPKNSSINIHKDIVTNDYAKTTIDGAEYAANDGNDTVATETLCDLVQTNYDSEGNGSIANDTKLDGDNKTGLVHQIDANIGDIITQVISCDVPALVDDIDDEFDGANRDNAFRKHNKTYKVTDRMTKGLNLIDKSSFLVTLSKGVWNDYSAANTITLVEGTDYTLEIAADKMSYVLTMTEEGLKKFDDITSASYLYIKYDVQLTKDALIGTDTYGNTRQVQKADPSTEGELAGGEIADDLVVVGTTPYISEDGLEHPEATNQNTAMLTYATDRTMEHDYFSNTTKVFTYEIDLTKTFTDGTQGYVSKNADGKPSFDYSAVRFTVRGSVAAGSVDSKKAEYSNGYEDIIFIRTGDGQYRVWDAINDGGTYMAAQDTLDAAVAERPVLTKYVSPSTVSGLLTLTGLDARTYEFTEVATAQGRNLMAQKFYAELVAPVVDGKTLEDGSLEHAYVWSGEKPAEADLAKYDLVSYSVNKARMDEGRAPFTVQNNEIIKVLKTGGNGVYAYMFAGAAMMAVGMFFFFRKREESANVA